MHSPYSSSSAKAASDAEADPPQRWRCATTNVAKQVMSLHQSSCRHRWRMLPWNRATFYSCLAVCTIARQHSPRSAHAAGAVREPASLHDRRLETDTDGWTWLAPLKDASTALELPEAAELLDTPNGMTSACDLHCPCLCAAQEVLSTAPSPTAPSGLPMPCTSHATPQCPSGSILLRKALDGALHSSRVR